MGDSSKFLKCRHFAVGHILIILILSIIFVLAFRANIDLSSGSHVLDMDERITFNGVQNILHPKSINSFMYGIYNGGDHRYGRILWNSIAFFSFVPELLFGEQGQIVASRMLQVILLFTSILIISLGLVKKTYLRVILICLLLALPYSSYFMTLPKPEPLVLLFLSLFFVFYFYDKRSWIWIFLGLAFGAKISTLPVVVVFLFIEYVWLYRRRSWGQGIEKYNFDGIYYFFLGLCLAVPILMPVLVGIILCNFIILALGRRWASFFNYRHIARVVGYFLILLSCKRLLMIWINSTFLSINHGSDLYTVNAKAWIVFVYEQWHDLPQYLWISFISSLVALLILGLRKFILEGRKSSASNHSLKSGLVIFFIGCILNLSIFFSAQRLWGFYLYPGFFLMVSGAMILIDSLTDGQSVNQDWMTKAAKYFCYFIVAQAFTIFCFWFKAEFDQLSGLMRRSSSAEFLEQSASYDAVLKFLNKISDGGSGARVLTIAYDPSMFLPRSTTRYQVQEFWGPYKAWGVAPTPDFIVFSSIHVLKNQTANPDSSDYSDALQARIGYVEYVIQPGEQCLKRICYRKALALPNGGEVLVKEAAEFDNQSTTKQDKIH